MQVLHEWTAAEQERLKVRLSELGDSCADAQSFDLRSDRQTGT